MAWSSHSDPRQMNAAYNPTGALTVPTYGNSPGAQGPSTLSTNDGQPFNKDVYERFGMPQNGDPLKNPYGAVRTSYETYPEAFGGAYGSGTTRNRHVETILISQIADSDRFIPMRVFPILLNLDGGTKFTVRQIKFHNHELDRVPELGVPRMVTKSSSQWEVNTARFGLGFFMEYGFAMTPIGQRQYDMSILQIRNAVWETIDRDAYAQLLSCSRTAQQVEFFWQHFNAPFGSAARIGQIIDYECEYWGALNRREHAITKLIDQAEKMMKKHGLKPEICMGPHGFTSLIGRRPELSEFLRIGEIASKAQGSAEGNLRIYEPRGIQFHEVALVTNNIDEAYEQPEDPLVRTRTIGTFFQMNHPCRDMQTDQAGANAYRSHFSDIAVHNCDTDQMETLRRADVEANCAFDERILEALAIKANPAFAGNSPTWRAYLAAINAKSKLWQGAVDGDGASTAPASVFGQVCAAADTAFGGRATLSNTGAAGDCMTRVHAFLSALRGLNVMAPFNYLICRPFERWNMGSLIFTLGNGKAGFTSIGQQDFQLGQNPVNKYLEGTFTCNLGVVIENRDAVFVFHNVKYGEYLGGGGCQFFNPARPEAVIDAIHNRGQVDFVPSLMVVPYDVHERIVRPHIDFTGYFTAAEQRESRAGEGMHFSTAQAAADFWRIDPTPESYMFDTTYHAYEGSRGNGSRMSQGHQLMYGYSGVPSEVPRPQSVQMIGRGHHGPFTYPGVNADRQGKGGRAYVAVNTIYDDTAIFMNR